jgi:DNA mismatch repair protein MutH
MATKRSSPTSSRKTLKKANTSTEVDESYPTIPVSTKTSKCKPCPAVRPTLMNVYNKVMEIKDTKYELTKTTNKGNPGIFLEKLVGIPISSACLDCLDGEVKAFPVKKLKKGEYVPKETIAITMLSKESLKDDDFKDSRCYKKMTKILYVPYYRDGDDIMFLEPTIIDLEVRPELFEQLEQDYQTIREKFIETNTLDGTSSLGKYLQNRTKGAGKDAPKTRAYYLRPNFIKDFVPINMPK